MMSDRIRVEFDHSVGRVVLCRPEAANAIDLTFAREFEQAAASCRIEQVRAVIITSEGPRFCVGGDVKSFSAQSDLPSHLREVTEHLHAGIIAFVEMDAPVVVAVQGAAAGGGLGLVCAADVAIAGVSASFVMAFTALGLSPDSSSSWFLSRHVGLGRALDLTLTNRVLRAPEALEWGLVSRVVDDEQLAEEADQLARQLANGPTTAYGASTRLLRSAANNPLRPHLNEEAGSIAQLAHTPDGREGISAFVDRRTATFVGGDGLD
jgi:2-(1,2-epoxy-1,2-dihydrophenyl)acetyl-CoA isomerase